MLFYLSGNNGFNADYSAGKGEPNFLNEVKILLFRIPAEQWYQHKHQQQSGQTTADYF